MAGLAVRSLAGGSLVLPAASRSRRRSVLLCARASLRGVVSSSTTTTSTSDRRQLAVSIDELRLGRDDPVVTIHTAPAAPEEDGGKAVEKLRAIAEAAADRAEMHDIIGRQRDNWNHLLLHSTNSLTLAASAMAALAPAAPNMVALKASAGVLLATAAVTMAAVNKIQPSQLAEEQRNATRLWRELERGVRAQLAHTVTTEADVEDAMERVLALDAAYPLPLLPVMLEKFPKTVEPARWWPKKKPAVQKSSRSFGPARRGSSSGNGWTQELEEEMRGIVRVIKAKDEQEFLSVGKLVLGLNKGLALAGPALAGTAALATIFIGTGADSGPTSWASGAAVVGGALAAAVNTMEHGGQLGMVFELLRNCAGFYRKIQEDIEAALAEPDVERRESGEVFATKIALKLGRSVSDLKQFGKMASASVRDEDIKYFAGKLF
ncbi:probable F-box protein At4g22030 [Brachypodium distachyon]|uniref:F-box protein n=1 Tax=Brachypodium distachyon TaxID=15368 RepID=I1HYW0_BRADI|nr:probable F-box protein At4g22030 [Brachypodium distachyon]KQJ94094.1 hypothetical protein BRADI_3g08450v3 [Brachypodium distachyon]|eukprot:XP_003571128.1 probable F-box protein At4g22030 [Brachypodium distachyon]